MAKELFNLFAWGVPWDGDNFTTTAENEVGVDGFDVRFTAGILLGRGNYAYDWALFELVIGSEDEDKQK